MHSIPPVTLALIITNVVVFLGQLATGRLLEDLFALWPLGSEFLPWQVVTYSFLHAQDNMFHLLFNMLALYMFGSDIERIFGQRRYLTYYLSAVLTAAIAQLTVSALAGSPPYPTVGASGGVFGILLAFALYFPRRIIVLIIPPIPMPAWLFVILYGLIELYLGVTGTQQGVAHFAHLGGYLGAWVYLIWMERRSPAKQWKAKLEKPGKKVDLGNWKHIDTKSIHEVNRAEVDRILDKISSKGVDSLTPQERTFLSHFAPPDDRPVRPT